MVVVSLKEASAASSADMVSSPSDPLVADPRRPRRDSREIRELVERSMAEVQAKDGRCKSRMPDIVPALNDSS